MSLKDLFSKEGRKERALQKACTKAANQKIKPDERRPALYDLLEVTRATRDLQSELEKKPQNSELREAMETAARHSEEAISYLLRRLTFIYDTNIVVDEEEKNMVYEGLLNLGERILPQLVKHLKTAPTLSWGLRLLNETSSRETTWKVLTEILANYEPGYERDPSRKIQLMTFLGDFHDPRAVEVLIPFLTDHDETVRFVTVESLFKQKDEQAREPLLQLMTNEEEESLRIKNRIAEGFCETGWLVKGFRGSVEKILSEDYLIDSKGKIKLKKAREQQE